MSCENEGLKTDPNAIFRPLEMEDWANSTPAKQGLDPDLILTLYNEAEALSNIYSLLIVRNDYLVAERYFNNKSVLSSHKIASVTKSYVSALTGIALRENVLSGLDKNMVSFFPEYPWESLDPRKSDITLREILQMRSGYPWEEFEGYFDELSTNNWLDLLPEFPLTHDPGEQFGYSNLTSHVMGVIIARSASMTLMDFANNYLCDPLGIELTQWPQDASGYYYGSGGMQFRSRDLAKFGNLYLNNGKYHNMQLIPEEWINESLQEYSTSLYGNHLGLYLYNIGYGYLWWSATAGNHSFNFAWGHGGQLVIIIQEMNMVIVVTADPLDREYGDTAWVKTRKIIDLVAKYIASLT